MLSSTQKVLRAASFTMAAAEPKQLLHDQGLEIAFAGRSNAGKSSAINALTGRPSLARTSKTPGRTQQIIFFELDETRRLVDLPGYGFAKVPNRIKKHWRTLMAGYFTDRSSLQGLILLMDIRHPLRDEDIQMIDWCADTQTPLHILLTKSDKLSKGAAANQLQKVKKELEDLGFEGASMQLFSSLKKTGLVATLDIMTEWLNIPHE